MAGTVAKRVLLLALFGFWTGVGIAAAKDPKTKLKAYWNVPTFQCEPYGLNFTIFSEKYGIAQNPGDKFRGAEIAILYDPGAFPAILERDDDDGRKKKKRKYLRNGGVPQEGNLTAHLDLFKETLDSLVPDPDFGGIGVIDFESWRPIYRQNFGTLEPYQRLSEEIETRLHPHWPKRLIEKEAQRRFELYAKLFMEETLLYAKKSRPKATWGYYSYPLCFNMSPNNMHKNCPGEVQRENSRISWLFVNGSNFHPSLYLPQKRLTSRQKRMMIEGRLDEVHRLIRIIGKKQEPPKILPYFWYKYQDTRNFVTKDELYDSLKMIRSSEVDGFVLWGSSKDVNSRNSCHSLYEYIDGILGPILLDLAEDRYLTRF